eukprot:TRINITY_DN31990_c0_g1_i4.p1 TRINITY_DN31990_c0_g1~~TRINITY_DN31990_c0_g1_i4.p1  ORF type:complete len:661 (+),score=110.72 TRINITY_DN31990_c0_g1_i4:67-2049(+)
MGIRGLSTYFSDHGSHFENVEISDTEVIVDGNNLYFLLTASCKGLNNAFGGDYYKLYKCFVEYFTTMKNCGISPYLVFDGGHEEIKMKTARKRRLESIRKAVTLGPSSQHKAPGLNSMGKLLFLDVLEELNIKVFQTEFEADREIAWLAMQKNCPVMSNDSDFFIFSVDYIKLDSIDIEGSKSCGKLICSQFNRQKFIQRHNLHSVELLHLMASLIGNDYISMSDLETIFTSIKLPPPRKNWTERHRRIQSIINWLSKEKDTNVAIDRILGCYPMTARPKLKQKILDSMSMYAGHDPSHQVLVEPACLQPHLRDLYTKCRLTARSVDVVTRREVYLGCTQVEERNLESVEIQGLTLFKTQLSIICPEKMSIAIQCRIKRWYSVIEYYEVDPINVLELDKEKRLELIHRSLHAPLESKVREKLEPETYGLFLVMNLWCENNHPSQYLVIALLIFRFLILYVEPHVAQTNSIKKLQAALNSKATPSRKIPYMQCMLAYAQFFHLDDSMRTSDKNYDRSLVHVCNIIQAIYKRTRQLNTLLANPITLPSVNHFFCGVFLYNFYTHISSKGVQHVDPNLLDGSLLPSECRDEFVRVKAVFLEHLSVDRSDLGLGATRKKRTRKPRKKDEGGKAVLAVDEVKTTSDDSDSSFCDLDNRFSVLGIS